MSKPKAPASSSPDLPPALLTPEAAARFLAVSTRHLRDLTRDGVLPYVNVGRHERETRRYLREDLEAFIAGRRRQHGAHDKRTMPRVAEEDMSPTAQKFLVLLREKMAEMRDPSPKRRRAKT